MRMRKRPNLAPRMEKCARLLETVPEECRGKWLPQDGTFEKVELEIGCGKGRFTVETAAAAPHTLLVALEKVPDAMILAMERADRMGLNNVRFIDADAAKLTELFAPGEVSRIYLNFCDPWPKSRDAKFRLTSPNFLRADATVLPVGGEIAFKTDNTPLFIWSKGILEEEGWELRDVTFDLHKDGVCGVMTDYEAKFTAEGMKINRLVAVKTEKTKTTAEGIVPRLKNASLCDARGYESSQKAAEEKEE